MKDQTKTKRLAIDELTQMRRWVAESEAVDTERLQAEEAVQKSEEKYRSLVESTEDSVYLVDKTGTYLLMNKECLDRFGLPIDKVLGRTYGEFHSEKKTREFTEKLERVFETSGPVQYEHTSERDDHCFLRTLSPVKDQEGQITAVTVISKDITERKRAEEALSESEERFRTLFDNLTIGVYRTTPDGRILMANPVLVQMLGYSSFKELAQRNLEDTGFEPTYPRSSFKEGIEKEGQGVGLESAWERQDGSTLFIRESARAVRDNAGNTLYYEGTAENVTERKQAEESVRKLNQYLESVIDNADVWLNVLDKEGNVLIWNKAAEAICGFTREEVIGHDKIWEWNYPDPAYRSTIEGQTKEIIESGKILEGFETTIHCKDGQTKIMSWNERRLSDEKGNPIGSISLGRDITQQKRAEEALRESEQRLKDALALGQTGYWEFDIDAQRISWSDQAFRLFERDLSLGAPTVEEEATYYSREQAEKLREYTRRAIEGREVIEYDFQARLPSGRFAYMMGFMRPITDASGLVVKLFGVFHDITERKRAEEALYKAEARYSELVERSKDGIVVIQDGVLKFVNSAAIELFGYSHEEVLEKSFLEFIPFTSRNIVQKRYIERMAGEPVPSIYEIKLLKKDGSTVPVELNAGRVEIEGKSADLVFIRDITDRKLEAEKLRKALEGTIQAVGLTTETRDPYTAGHQKRVTQLACSIAQEMGFSEEQIEDIRVAGLMHDIGKVSIPAEILSKPRRLTNMEYALVQGHSQVAYDILKTAELPWPIAQIVLQHHERLDGSGYPQGLKGEEIMLEARILAVADVVEAMASHRPYRPALGMDAALEEIALHKGNLYDSGVVDACLRLFAEKDFQFED